MKLEIYYHDPAIPGVTFLHVNTFKTKKKAEGYIRSLGYEPVRIKRLGFGNGI